LVLLLAQEVLSGLAAVGDCQGLRVGKVALGVVRGLRFELEEVY
jgi:hypothetical protein